MTLVYSNLGIGGFLDLLFGQTGSLTKTYTLPATDASFVVETNLEKYGALGLASDPFDNWDSYNLVSQNGTGATSTTGGTAGGGTQHRDLGLEHRPKDRFAARHSFNVKSDCALASDNTQKTAWGLAAAALSPRTTLAQAAQFCARNDFAGVAA